MKKIITVVMLMVLMVTIGININGATKEKGIMQFSEKVHDFGTVKEKGGPVSVEFPFTNTGNANLVIYRAKAECGCTTPEYSDAPIAPGKSGTIKVTYNPLGQPGAFEKTITLWTNGKPGKVHLKIRGTVMPKK